MRHVPWLALVVMAIGWVPWWLPIDSNGEKLICTIGLTMVVLLMRATGVMERLNPDVDVHFNPDIDVHGAAPSAELTREDLLAMMEEHRRRDIDTRPSPPAKKVEFFVSTPMDDLELEHLDDMLLVCPRNIPIDKCLQCQYVLRLRAEHVFLKSQVAELKDEIKLDDQIIKERTKLLHMFDCPDHGECIPYAIKCVEEMRSALVDASQIIESMAKGIMDRESLLSGHWEANVEKLKGLAKP